MSEKNSQKKRPGLKFGDAKNRLAHFKDLDFCNFSDP